MESFAIDVHLVPELTLDAICLASKSFDSIQSRVHKNCEKKKTKFNWIVRAAVIFLIVINDRRINWLAQNARTPISLVFSRAILITHLLPFSI